MGEKTEENPLSCRPASLEEISGVWDGAPLENRRHFLRAILETFSNASIADNGQRIGLVEFSRLAEKKLGSITKNVQDYIIMAYDSDKKNFNFSQAKRRVEVSC